MDIAALARTQPLALASLPAEQRLYRVQLPAPRSTSVVVGPVIMAPAGTMAYRFDLALQAVSYFGLTPATAVYETLARRDSRSIVLSTVKARDLLTAELHSSGLRIADLRPHVGDWPVLLATRYSSTQALAADLHARGYDGALYSSAQHVSMDCLALFGAANAATVAVSWVPLFDAALGRTQACVIDAARGAELPII